MQLHFILAPDCASKMTDILSRVNSLQSVVSKETKSSEAEYCVKNIDHVPRPVSDATILGVLVIVSLVPATIRKIFRPGTSI